MNKANLKAYAPQARLDFIAAVTARANLLGITLQGVSPVEVCGDVAIIEGREWPAKIAAQREKLIDRIKRHGFELSMEEVAYTWFNRFAALRYMELHDYLGHGWRVLSSRNGGLPEVISHASELTLAGLSQERARDLQLAGNQDNELYKLLLVAQCNELSRSMPFMFERIDDDTELLLPENLLRTDSVLAKLVNLVPEDDWSQIEVVGWLYQFYIGAKKKQVIGTVVKSEDIPAATQLFTPNWIVKYLVQNSVGRLWATSNADSTLSAEWEYYVEPVAQSESAIATLQALRDERLASDGGVLNPESITILDPACGSGHILVVAYDILRSIYLERGYQPRSIPRLILERNLFGIDIDERAAQMAGFALLMRARADDRQLLNDPPRLNVLALRESRGIDLARTAQYVGGSIAAREALASLVATFEDTKTFGSLTKIPPALEEALPELSRVVDVALISGDLYAQAAAQDLAPLVLQATVLASRFDVVVANPPYMGGKNMNPELKKFSKVEYPDSKADLFAMFIERGFAWCKPTGFNSMVTMQTWMFLTSYESMRERILQDRTIVTMAHLGPRAFSEISGEVVQTTAFVIQRQHVEGYQGSYFRLVDGHEEAKAEALRVRRNLFSEVGQEEFARIPGSPIAYWSPSHVVDLFQSSTALMDYARPRQGMATTSDERFLRRWWEVSADTMCANARDREEAKASGRKWFPFLKGGDFRKWYGNNEYVVNFGNDGEEVCRFIDTTPGAKVGSNGRVINRESYFKPMVSWTLISGGATAFRHCDPGFVLGHKGPGIVGDEQTLDNCISFLNSNVAAYLLEILAPTMGFEVGQVSKLPMTHLHGNGAEAVALAREDWDSYETSWGFRSHPWLDVGSEPTGLEASWERWKERKDLMVVRMREIEMANNQHFIDAYGLGGDLTAEVPEDQITLAPADRERDAQRLISYLVGCVMGRYSLGSEGLVYASFEGRGFQPGRYDGFAADVDGIAPITDEPWFADDVSARCGEFLAAACGEEHLQANLAWLAQSLGQKASEKSDEAIRRYVSGKFYKDHVQAYKKRPIYWLFSSGRQGAFQALVYVHRFDDNTLPRMRSQYVVPLMGKFTSRIEMLERDVTGAGSASARAKVQKQLEGLRKKQAELIAYEEQLRHYAEMRIRIDLDDGVKGNYAKFGDLLAESKAICGASDE